MKYYDGTFETKEMFLLWIWPSKRLSEIEKEVCTTLIGNILGKKMFPKKVMVFISIKRPDSWDDY